MCSQPCRPGLTKKQLGEIRSGVETILARGKSFSSISLQKPLTIMNESQILDEYEQPSFNTTIDEQDLPVIYHCSSALFR